MNVYLSKLKKVSSQIKSLDNCRSSGRVTFILHITSIQAYSLEEEGRSCIYFQYGEFKINIRMLVKRVDDIIVLCLVLSPLFTYKLPGARLPSPC